MVRIAIEEPGARFRYSISRLTRRFRPRRVKGRIFKLWDRKLGSDPLLVQAGIEGLYICASVGCEDSADRGIVQARKSVHLMDNNRACIASAISHSLDVSSQLFYENSFSKLGLGTNL